MCLSSFGFGSFGAKFFLKIKVHVKAIGSKISIFENSKGPDTSQKESFRAENLFGLFAGSQKSANQF